MMRLTTLCFVHVCFVAASLTTALLAQTPQTERRAADVISTVPSLAGMPPTLAATELTIRWLVTPSVTGDPTAPGDTRPINEFEVVRRRAVDHQFVRERDPQLSVDDLVLVGLDASGREISWQKVKDPRLVRAEFPSSSGELSGRVLHRPLTEIVARLPDGLAAVALRIYETQWTGTQFVLRQLGDVTVGPQ
jgi:hypothetical protein